jgi:hypothetical protein
MVVTGFLIGAAVALGLAGYLAWQALQAKERHKKMFLTETSTTGFVKELHQTAVGAAGVGVFAEHVELEGVAIAGPDGLLTSEISKTPCVWHRHKVTRKYKDVYHDSKGNRKTRTREEEMTSHRSRDPFLLRDDDGEIKVVPFRSVKGARKVVSEYKEHKGSTTNLKLGSFQISLPTSGDGATLGHTYEEWVLLPDTRIFVSGQANDKDGELALRDPKGKEDLVISAKLEDELLDEASGEVKKYAALAALAVVAAIAILVWGFVR